ncbi:MAG: hypothetical protein ACFB0G_07810 [Leptolyngbyaceae cyanobacterium]
MRFPLWSYLNQPLWDRDRPAVLNPWQYWQHCCHAHAQRCLNNEFLEQCWQTCYQEFINNHPNLCVRSPLEEDPRWLIERCWQIKRRNCLGSHPENLTRESER